MADVGALKKVACKAMLDHKDDLHKLSQAIWSRPELSYNEYFAHTTITDFLEKVGFTGVERKYVVDTGFRAVYGEKDKPHVVVICEYDALPEIGHACGHNLIAEAGVAAGIGIKAAMDAAKEDGVDLGKLTVLGTPAEEEGGGKIDMLKAGVFEGVDAAMMVHPTPYSSISVDELVARQSVSVRYKGKATHASGHPWEGINALDAAVTAYNNVSVMRQQMKPTWKIHGVILRGGVRANIIPETSELDFMIRAPTMAELQQVRTKIHQCFEGAAKATGCEVDIKWEKNPYMNVLTNPTLASLYESNAGSLGVTFKDKVDLAGSTDMGNVSHEVPSIEPFYRIETTGMNHSREFTDATGDICAQTPTLAQAQTMAMTAIDVLCQPHLAATMAVELRKQRQDQAS